MHDELAKHLNALERDECYRVDAVLKHATHERTERVFFVGANGAELGPLVRKRIDRDAGLGMAYRSICAAQQEGRRFRYLPRVIECCDAGGEFIVIMEHVGGETLADVVYRCDPSLALACDIFPRLCDAVSELHEGFTPAIIHRDLKPSNVMLSRDGMTIIDFGIARSFKEDAEEDTRRFGTRAYAPPEQFGFGQTDVRSDVYALGMLLYFCLSEKTPDVKARKEGFRTPLIPEPLRQVIERAAAFDPQDRFASVADLKGAFLMAVGAPPQVGTLVAAGMAPGGLIAYAPPSHTSQQSSDAVSSHKPSFFGRALARIPRGIGMAWDIILFLFLVLLIISGVYQCIDPSAGSFSDPAFPLWRRVLASAGIVFGVVAPVLFAISDRRPLRRLIPAFAHVSIERDMAVSFVVLLVGALVIALTR